MYAFVIIVLTIVDIQSYYVPVWSGYNPLLSLECNNNKRQL